MTLETFLVLVMVLNVIALVAAAMFVVVLTVRWAADLVHAALTSIQSERRRYHTFKETR